MVLPEGIATSSPVRGLRPHAAFARLDDEDAEASQLYALAARERLLHRVEKGVYGLFGLHLRHARALGHAVDDVEFNHFASASDSGSAKCFGGNLSKGDNTLRRDNREAPRGLSRIPAEVDNARAPG